MYCHSQQSDQGLHYLPFSADWSSSRSTVILRNNQNKIYTICRSEQSDLSLHYLPFSVWSGSTIFAILSSLIIHSYDKSRSSIMQIYTVCHSQQSDQGLYYLSFSAIWSRSTLSFSAVWSGSTLFAIRSSLIKVKVHCHPQKQSDQGLNYLPFSAVWSTLFAILSMIRVYTVCHF